MIVGPDHPYVRGKLSMDIAGGGYGMSDLFTWQARSFLDEIAGVAVLPVGARLADGLRNLPVLHAVVDSASSDGGVWT